MNIVDVLRLKHPSLDVHNSTSGQPWYYESLLNRDTLLVTAGDSWTWGNGLCDIDINKGITDHPDRVKYIYGSLLAHKIDSDFINLAMCGINNELLLHTLESLLELIQFKYKKIIVVITLTELLRELRLDHEWIPNNQDSLLSFLSGYERNMFSYLSKIANKFDSINFLIARSFTYSFEENKSLLSDLVDKSWVDCLAEKQNSSSYPKDVRILSKIALEPLNKYIHQKKLIQKYSEEFEGIFLSSMKAINWLMNSNYNFKWSHTNHPNEEGHKIWADYLYEEIKTRLLINH